VSIYRDPPEQVVRIIPLYGQRDVERVSRWRHKPGCMPPTVEMPEAGPGRWTIVSVSEIDMGGPCYTVRVKAIRALELLPVRMIDPGPAARDRVPEPEVTT